VKRHGLILSLLVAGCFTPVDEPEGDEDFLSPPRRDAGIPDAGVSMIDAGLPDAGRADAGRPDSGSLPEDAGWDAGEGDAGSDVDAGELDAGELDAGEPDAGPPVLPVCTTPPGSCSNARTDTCTLSGRCDMLTTIRSLSCVGGTCSCKVGTMVTNTFTLPPGHCAVPGVLEAHWACSCGWATPRPPICGPQGGLGAPCGLTGGCQNGVCRRIDNQQYCSAECYLSCPCGFTCVPFFGLAYCEPP
jgi:hypothetical protein